MRIEIHSVVLSAMRRTPKRNFCSKTDYIDINEFSLGLHELVLFLFGFIPPLLPDHHRHSGPIKLCGLKNVLAYSIITGAFFSCILWGLVALLDVINSRNTLLRTLSLVPYVLYNIRGFVVLTIFLSNRKSWKSIRFAVIHLLSTTFPENSERKIPLKKLKNIGHVLAVLTFGLACFLESLDWYSYFADSPAKFSQDYNMGLYPLPVPLTSVQNIVIWTVFSSFPFYLSQLIFVIIITDATVLRHCVEETDCAMSAMARRCKVQEINPVEPKNCKTLVASLDHLREIHLQVVVLCAKMDGAYNVILFFIFIFDMATLCGFMAAALSHEAMFSYRNVQNFGGVAIFGFHGLLALPIVQLYETGLKIHLRLHQLIHALQPILQVPEGYFLKITADIFCATVRTHTIIFTGAEILRINRNLLAGTGTFVVSAAIVAHEVLIPQLDAHCLQPAPMNISNFADAANGSLSY